MGCCYSTAEHSSPYPSAGPSSSSRAIASSQPQSNTGFPRPSTHASSHSTRPPQHHHQQQQQQEHQQPPLSAHINRPLKPHVWSSENRLWTRAEIDRERTEFFDTRVSGNPQVWQTIRVALELLWSGGEGDVNGGLATAQTIFDAAGITLPTGDLANGVYDALGQSYSLPEVIVSDPTNIVGSLDGDAGSMPPNEAGDKIPDGEGSDDMDEDEVLRRREEKGKGILNPKDAIEVRARLSNAGGEDLVVSIGKDDSVGSLTSRIYEESGISPPKRIRIIYLGRELNQKESLSSQGWKDGHVINAFVAV